MTSSYAQGIHAPREKTFLPRFAFKEQELIGDTIVKPGDALSRARSTLVPTPFSHYIAIVR